MKKQFNIEADDRLIEAVAELADVRACSRRTIAETALLALIRSDPTAQDEAFAAYRAFTPRKLRTPHAPHR